MARIRSIKPEVCSSKDSGALSREARLFFVLLFTEADDEGRLQWIPRKLCGVLYPHDDDVTPALLTAWAAQCATRRMLSIYEIDGEEYLQVTNWTKHQKISHPTKSRLPAPDQPSARLVLGLEPDLFRNGSAALRINSGDTTEPLRPDLGTGNREQGTGIESSDEDSPRSTVVDLRPGHATVPECPHELIVDAYHAELPQLRRVREWTDDRQRMLRSRWREKPERQSLDWWRGFFAYIAKSDFLTGRAPGREGRPFDCDLEWIVRPTNFRKIVEGKYENRGSASA